MKSLMLVFLLTLIIFERGTKSLADEFERLEASKRELAIKSEAALVLKQNLERQVMSQSDPNWIGLTLIRVLGVVPEGQTKVYFKSR